MKPALSAVCAIGLLMVYVGCATQGTGGGATGTGAVVTVQYINPQSFRDFSVQGRDLRFSTTSFTQQVTQGLEPVMRSQFPGHALTLRFTDIDLAGRRTAGPGSVRVVRTRTPARLSFDYVLRDQSGRSVASGPVRLVDTSTTGSRTRSGPLSTEVRMLQQWLRGVSAPR